MNSRCNLFKSVPLRQAPLRLGGWLVLAVALSFGGSNLFAFGLTSGRYEFQAQYALVCLYGTYPITVNTMTTHCYLSVNTDATGALSGILDVRTVPGIATGTFTSQNNAVSVHLHAVGQDPYNTVSDIDAQLYGTSQLIGTASINDQSGQCTMDVSAAGPLLLTFDVDVTVDPQGAVIGSGTANGCDVQVPVNVTGSNGPGNCVLNIVGANLPSFTWYGSGPPTQAGFTAAWSGNGFGAIAGGTGLEITAPSPSPTPTASPTPSVPPSPSPTPTATSTATFTPTATATATPTATATYSPTPAPTPTPELSPTSTPTATLTPTPTTPPSSPTPTPTATATVTPTATVAPVPLPPRVRKATNVTTDSFTANWSRAANAIGYRLDVSTSRSFSNYVPGYVNLDVGNVTNRSVNGLTANTYYYYRIRAYNGNGTSRNSNVIRVKTTSH